MSVEVLSIVIAAAGLLITLGGGFFAGLAWLIRRMDERFDNVDERISSVESELSEVTVAVARVEGPRERLIFPRSGGPYFS